AATGGGGPGGNPRGVEGAAPAPAGLPETPAQTQPLLSRILNALLGPPVWRLVVEDGFTFAVRADEVTDDHVVVTAPLKFRSRRAAIRHRRRLRDEALETPKAVH
ncbi:MAG: hypothetical protein KF842_14680, partial [Caulobacter sp.]|nr:hypothetical protein [Caulobacter sp.]